MRIMALELHLFSPRTRRDDLVFIVSHSTSVACDSVIEERGSFARTLAQDSRFIATDRCQSHAMP